MKPCGCSTVVVLLQASANLVLEPANAHDVGSWPTSPDPEGRTLAQTCTHFNKSSSFCPKAAGFDQNLIYRQLLHFSKNTCLSADLAEGLDLSKLNGCITFGTQVKGTIWAGTGSHAMFADWSGPCFVEVLQVPSVAVQHDHQHSY